MFFLLEEAEGGCTFLLPSFPIWVEIAVGLEILFTEFPLIPFSFKEDRSC